MTYFDLSSISTLLIDLDGTVYRGEELLPGAIEFFQFLYSHEYSFALLTNNSTATRSQYAKRLASMGINVSEPAIFTSGEAVAGYLSKRAPKGAGVYIIGEDGLREPMLRAGFKLDDVSPEYVLVGLDRHFTYDAMAKACLAIRRGAKFIASNPDKTFPAEHDAILPGAGALIASIVACTDVRPLVVGKPSKQMPLLAMENLGAKKRRTAIVGDRIDTDILAGKRAGICTILVLTGVTSQEDLAQSKIKPDYVFRDLVHLQTVLDELRSTTQSTDEIIERHPVM